jgi:cystathionine beta-lyase
VKDAANQLGQFASADDCWLCLRGLRTLPVRLKQQAENGLAVARWLESRPEVLRLLHPALPSHPQHAIYARDFTGTCSLFGLVLQPRYSEADAEAVVDALALFGIGASWGGYESLALPTAPSITRTAKDPGLGGPAIRLHIGLEEPDDLIADLAQALDRLPR